MTNTKKAAIELSNELVRVSNTRTDPSSAPTATNSTNSTDKVI